MDTVFLANNYFLILSYLVGKIRVENISRENNISLTELHKFKFLCLWNVYVKYGGVLIIL